jgi:hypothetical protein
MMFLFDFAADCEYNTIRRKEQASGLFAGRNLPFQNHPVNGYSTVFCVPVHTFHAVVADLFRIQVAQVTFTAPDTLPVIQYTLAMDSHPGITSVLFIIPLWEKKGQESIWRLRFI